MIGCRRVIVIRVIVVVVAGTTFEYSKIIVKKIPSMDVLFVC